MKEFGIINSLSEANMDKCETCAETKITKKPCKSITRETKLLGLVHSGLGDLKHTMTRGGKRFGNNFCFLILKTCFGEYKEKKIFFYF